MGDPLIPYEFQVTPRDLPNENTTGLTAADLVEMYNASLDRNEKIKFENMFLKGLYLTPKRILQQEKKTATGAITVSGWYQVAKTSVFQGDAIKADFKLFGYGTNRGGMIEVKTAFSNNNNTDRAIEYLKSTGSPGLYGAKYARLAYSNSVPTAGAYLEVYLDVFSGAALTFGIQMLGNFTDLRSSVNSYGWQLIDPVISDGLCPDGVTSAIFLEAGAEFSLDTKNSTTIIEGISAVKSGDSQLRCSCRWEEIPKTPTGQIIFEEPNVSLVVRDGSGASVNIKLQTYTISGTLICSRKRVQFNIDFTGTPLSVLSTSKISFVGASTDGSGKLTIV